MGKWGYIHHGFQREVTGDGGMGFPTNQENQSTVFETGQYFQMENFNDDFGKDKVKVPNRYLFSPLILGGVPGAMTLFPWILSFTFSAFHQMLRSAEKVSMKNGG